LDVSSNQYQQFAGSRLRGFAARMAMVFALHGGFRYQKPSHVAFPMLQGDGIEGVIAFQMMASTPGKWDVWVCVHPQPCLLACHVRSTVRCTPSLCPSSVSCTMD
jgi:hypothetical protein